MIVTIRDKRIALAANVLDIFVGHIQDDQTKMEVGGILLGQVNSEYILVSRASLPSKHDKSSRCGFIRNKEVAQLIVDYEFYNSDGRTIYLGEWHTHPESDPTPSPQDQKMIRNQLTANTSELGFLLLVIVGVRSLFIGDYSVKRSIGRKLRNEATARVSIMKGGRQWQRLI
jgi:integrative and conjugative element protein (TIGR02256 family)